MLENDIVTENITRISGTNARKCMKCGKCSAACPAFDSIISPHKVVAMAAEGDAEALMETEALWKCLSCFACVERCPRGVEPANIIEGLRVTLLRKQGASCFKPEDVSGLLNNRIPQQAITSVFRKFSK